MNGVSKAVIQAVGLCKRYGDVQALDNVSFELFDGEILALIGPNGAGKTTLIRSVIGMQAPDSGSVTFPAFAGGFLPGLIGYVAEGAGLYEDATSLSVLTYLGVLRGMTRKNAKERALYWLDRVGLANRKTEKVKTLSKGNQQKIALVSAVLHRPRIAILDEPFSGLDPVFQEETINLLNELRGEGTTLLLSGHHMALLERMADRVLLINAGRALLYGPIDEILQSEPSDRTLRISTSSAADQTTIEALDGVSSVVVEGPHRLTIKLSPQADMSQVVSALTASVDLESIDSERCTLHDAYVRRVGEPIHETGEALAS